MDASALASKLNSLENSWSSVDAWLKFWIVLVVIGVAIELIVVFMEHSHGLREFRRGTIHSPDRPNFSMFMLELLGTGLIAIGVAGEFGIHIKAGKIETDMRDTTRQLVAIVEKEAGDANRETARLTFENLKLEAQIQPRSLSLEQQLAIGTTLLPFKGRKVVVSWSDPESYNFAAQIISALKFGKLDIGPSGLFSTSGRDPSYVINRSIGARLSWPPNQSDLGKALKEALEKIGHVRELSVMPSGEPDVRVWVFVKPFDILPETGIENQQTKAKESASP